MKRIFLFAIMLIVSFSVIGKEKLNEKQVIKKTHIDFSKEVIYFELLGLIEIDGHTFLNDTCISPIIYTSNLDGIKIIDVKNNIEYVHRKCSKIGCNVIHLKLKNELSINSNRLYFNSPDEGAYYGL